MAWARTIGGGRCRCHGFSLDDLSASFETPAVPAPQSLTGNELMFSNMLNFCRRSRESGNPGASGKPSAARRRQVVDMPVLLPWTPAFAGATIRCGFGWIHFESDSEEAASAAVSKDAQSRHLL